MIATGMHDMIEKCAQELTTSIPSILNRTKQKKNYDWNNTTKADDHSNPKKLWRQPRCLPAVSGKKDLWKRCMF